MWVLGASARPPFRFSNRRNPDPRQKEAQQSRIERQQMEWKSWEEAMEKKEQIYRSRKVSASEETYPEARRIQDGARKKYMMRGPRTGSYREEVPRNKKKEESDLMGTLYTRQRLYQKVDGFSRLLGLPDQQQAREQQSTEETLNQPEATLDDTIERPMIDQTIIRVLHEDTWDW